MNEALVDFGLHARCVAFDTGDIARAFITAVMVPIDDSVFFDQVEDTTPGFDQAVDAVTLICLDAGETIALRAAWAPAGGQEDHSAAHRSGGTGSMVCSKDSSRTSLRRRCVVRSGTSGRE